MKKHLKTKKVSRQKVPKEHNFNRKRRQKNVKYQRILGNWCQKKTVSREWDVERRDCQEKKVLRKRDAKR